MVLFLLMNNHHEMIPAFVTTLGGYHLTLGIPWLKHHDVKIDFASNSLTFESQYCLKNCVNDVTLAYGIEKELPHFLLAYAAQCALGHKVLDKNEILQILPKQYHEFLPLFLEKQKINYHFTEALIMGYHCAQGLSLLADQYTVLAPPSYQPYTNG